ncbi:MAG: hypothetical protein QXW94_04865 [Desulfurococcaceae archaeon]
MAEKPTAAFALALVGGILILIAGLVAAVIGTIGGLIASLVPVIEGFAGGLIIALAELGFIMGILVIIGAVMINSGVPSEVRTGSILVIIFSVLSLITCGGGFIIGFILALVGGILGLVWKPGAARPPPPPTPPPPQTQPSPFL